MTQNLSTRMTSLLDGYEATLEEISQIRGDLPDDKLAELDGRLRSIMTTVPENAADAGEILETILTDPILRTDLDPLVEAGLKTVADFLNRLAVS